MERYLYINIFDIYLSYVWWLLLCVRVVVLYYRCYKLLFIYRSIRLYWQLDAALWYFEWNSTEKIFYSKSLYFYHWIEIEIELNWIEWNSFHIFLQIVKLSILLSFLLILINSLMIDQCKIVVDQCIFSRFYWKLPNF